MVIRHHDKETTQHQTSTDNSRERVLVLRTLRPQKRQSTRCLARTVQLMQKKRTRQERIDNNARPLTTIASASSSPYSSSTKTTINPLPGEDCAVVAEEETHAERKKDQQQRNDRARGFIECSDSMEVMVQFWCQKLHTRCIRRGSYTQL